MKQHTRFLGPLDPMLIIGIVGFGLIYAWGTCLWDIPLPALDGKPIVVDNAVWLLSAIITPIALFILAILCRKHELSNYTWAASAGILLASLGTLCAYFSPFTIEPLQTVIEVLASIGTGLFPVISGLCLLRFRRLSENTSANIHPLNVAHVEHIAPANIARMVCVCFVLATLGCLVPFSGYDATAGSEALCTSLGMLLAIGLALSWTSFSRHINLESLIRWITIPVTLLLLSPVLIAPEGAYLSRVLNNVVFTGLEIIMVLYFVQLSQRTQLTESTLIGLGSGATYLGVLIGTFARGELTVYTDSHPNDVALICLILLSIYVLTMLIVPQRDAVLSSQSAAQAQLPDATSQPPLRPSSSCPASPGEALMEVSSETPTPAAEHAPSPTSTQDQRELLAQSFGLSRRETEIFLLLAQGRSRPYIRDALFLSKNTVATHIRHIYEKMNIHSQQELIDIVQEKDASISK